MQGMHAIQKIATNLILIPIIYVIGWATIIFFDYWHLRENLLIAVDRIYPTIQVLEDLKKDLQSHFNYLQARVLKAYVPGYKLIYEREGISITSLQSRVQEIYPGLEKNISFIKIINKLEALQKLRASFIQTLNTAKSEQQFVEALDILQDQAFPLYGDIISLIDELILLQKSQLQELYSDDISLLAVFLVPFLGLLGLGIILFYVRSSLQKDLAAPIVQLHEALVQRIVLPSQFLGEFRNIAIHISRLVEENKELDRVLAFLAKGNTRAEFKADILSETQALSILNIQANMEKNKQQLEALEGELGAVQHKFQNAQEELENLHNDLQAYKLAQEKGNLFIEVTPQGQLVRWQAQLLNLLAFHSWNQFPFSQLLSHIEKKEKILSPSLENVFEIRDGNQGTRFFLLNNNRLQNGNYLIYFTEVTALVNEIQQVQKQLSTLENELRELSLQHQNTLIELENTRQIVESTKQLKYRLVQQQATLQELMRNKDLKMGNVKEALRCITEAIAYALDEERVGIWLFLHRKQTIKCVDIYERATLYHSDGVELKRTDYPDFFEWLPYVTVAAITDVNKDNQLDKKFNLAYLSPNNVHSILIAPFFLGEMLAGFIMIEHAGRKKEWAIDEQNFLLSVAEILSLALEQGNKKVLEQELRLTLEESQALDEELRQSAEEIEATNEEMLRTQIELKGQISALNNAALVVETNLQGRIIYVNEGFLTRYKFSKEEVLGNKPNIVNSGHHPPEFFQELWSTISAGKVWKGEIKNLTKDKKPVWMAQTITPVLNTEGKPIKFIAVGFDITYQKEQEEKIRAALADALHKEELLQSSAYALQYTNEQMRRAQLELQGHINALNNSSMVYETDMEGNIIYVNDALLRVSGYKREELIGKRYTILKSGRQPDTIYQDQWRTILKGQIWKGELEKRTKDGDYFWVMVTNTCVLDEKGYPIKSINVLFDITEQKKQEFRLKKQQSALLELTSHPAFKEGNDEEAFPLIAKIGLEVLNASRASIWMYEEPNKLRCKTVVQNTPYHAHQPGTVLERDMYPIYIRTVEHDKIIAARDAVNDPRTKELAASLFKPSKIFSILDASIRLGAKPVGILSIEQTERHRDWTLDEQNFVSSLADSIGLVLEQKERLLSDKLKEAFAKLEEANREVLLQKHKLEETTASLMQSIKYAKRIQNNILPSKEMLEANLGSDNYFIVHRQRDGVGGDFYWFAAHGPEKVIVVADGTGHGVPGAFLTLIGYLLLNQIVNEKGILHPGEILYHLNLGVRTALKQDDEESRSTSRDGMDVAVCTINLDTKVALYAGANLPFYYYQDWEIHEIKPTKRSIGGEQLEGERTFQTHTIQLNSGDAIYMYTDGFVDQFGGPEEKRFSTKRFRELILRTQHESMATQRAMLNMEWKEWKEDREQLDDVTVFGFKIP
ncbi:MAG: PAS domain-containing protein [Bacteroidia bacterium]|nr:PAS domain-containing protein [Bacteroidia bacterium]MDW8159653.1 PAS domain-containing protein [Bacteroidia bacterium]